MKNFPHQFNDLSKLFNALDAIKELIEEERPLSDENFGELLTRKKIYTYRDKNLSIDEFLAVEENKPKANRGYLTVARDIRRLFQLLGFLIVYENKSGSLSPQAIQLITALDESVKIVLWKNSFLQLGLEGTDGEISHPYRILLKLVQDKPGIETKKLMLALEAENDSDEEYQRILALSNSSYENILVSTGSSESMAKNAVKILPGIAEQLNDIERKGNNSYSIGKVIITEDDISTDVPEESTNQNGVPYSQFRQVTSEDIAKDPIFNNVSSVSIDLTESIRIRQNRLAQHQEIVRQLGLLCEQNGFRLYEGKFDCLSTINDKAIVFEVKTILDTMSDQEKQTIKGVGQLKYYKFSIVRRQMGYMNSREILVYSQKPIFSLIEFCISENISICWLENKQFKIYDCESNSDIDLVPINLIR